MVYLVQGLNWVLKSLGPGDSLDGPGPFLWSYAMNDVLTTTHLVQGLSWVLKSRYPRKNERRTERKKEVEERRKIEERKKQERRKKEEVLLGDCQMTHHN